LPVLQAGLGGILPGEPPVLCSRVKVPSTGCWRALSRAQAHRILQEAFTTSELDGHLATQSLRKTFATWVYAVYEGDLRKTQKALGHQNINSTLRDPVLDDAEVDAGILVA
jgi:integrase